jgi:hypothetical protein
MARPMLQSTMMATARCLLALCVFGLLLGSNAAAMRATQKASRSNSEPLATRAASKGKPFSITGNVDDLYPGARALLNVEVSNPNSSPLTVRSIDVAVEDSDVIGCGSEWITPGRDVRISALVPAKSTAHLSYPVRMLKSAPAACQGATWTLAFTGGGTVPEGQNPPAGDGPNSEDPAEPNDQGANGSILPFTGFNTIMIAGLALASILIGAMLVIRRRARGEA